MEPARHDEVFSGDVVLYPEPDVFNPTRKHNARKRSEDSGLISPLSNAVTEDSPLLGNGRRHSSSGSKGNGNEEPVEWFGTADLRGLPWWKRPSVRSPFLHAIRDFAHT